MSLTSTPLASTASKRELSSPDDLAESKRNKQSVSMDMSQPELDESQVSLSNVTQATQHVQQVHLSKDDLLFVSSQLRESFETHLQSMVQSLVSAIVPEILNGLNSTLVDKVKKAENEQLVRRVEALEMEQDRAH